ncbi:WecB/TagA/CpsF family glycosyltransferase [Rhizobium sp. S152]|uniref:WecB/TagA/CpsF family glycosyltransferase n=1 Tax=Rhizobium sp. S152 TaxID=3055038 RepID=UPI0025A97D2E|nr:WecB/TagA/CpsF family glycosyltransferase [Rhizobium sp. S152]MDM9624616.1 WecB/TagA/CpsF family glycosyltransferase [Rhizobium sp. S152]
MTALDIPATTAGADTGVRRHFLGAPFDGIDQDAFVDLVERTAGGKFRYVVTPNVDHVVRLSGNRGLVPCYDEAWMSLCDSKPISSLAHVLSLDLPHVTGSDLTARLFKSVIRDGDVVALIASDTGVVRSLEAVYPTIRFRSHVPPRGVLHDPAAFAACVDFAAAEAARFVFIAIGSPQSEKIAHAISQRPDASGIGLCIGASLEFLVGSKTRAPLWMQRWGLEWAHRLGTDPRRLWRRYVFAVAPLARLFLRELVTRRPPGKAT